MNHPFFIDGRNVGQLSIIENNGRVKVEARCPLLNDGVYKAFIQGFERLAIGIMEPDGDEMLAARSFWPHEIRKIGDVSSGEALMTLPFSGYVSPVKAEEPVIVNVDWRPEPEPARLFSDSLLASLWSNIKNAMTKKENSDTLLAVPFSDGEPFTLLPLFCLAKPIEISGNRVLVFRINSGGHPVPAGDVFNT